MPDPTKLTDAAKLAVEQTIETLTALGRGELAGAAATLTEHAPAAAQWAAQRAIATAVNDRATVDQCDRDLSALAAAVAFDLAAAGVAAQAEG